MSPAAMLSNTVKPSILVFDSGVGGLSVYQEIRQLLPQLHYIYAFDNQGFPYGEKTESFIIKRVTDIVGNIQQHHAVSVIVIACNTASTITLPALRARFAIPVVGVVPAIKPAAKLTCNGMVGLLATKATVQRQYTHDLIERFAHDCTIKMIGSSELVVLAEDKLHERDVPRAALKHILRPWLSMVEPPDTVVLGCTHFPLLREELASVLPKGTRLIDSGAAIARRVAWLIENKPNVAGDSMMHIGPNIAYATQLNEEAEALKSVLTREGFMSLSELLL